MSIVVIGNFDGVHKGHQQILNRAKALAGDEKIVALTFDPHPVSIFAPDRAPTLLTILSDKIELLKIHNADQVAVIKFTKEFAAMSPEDFVNKVLVEQLKASTVIVGANFTYGFKAAGNVDSLAKHPEFETVVLDLQADNDENISSTRIRKAIVEGYVESAASGINAAINMERLINGKELLNFPTETAFGAMSYYITHASKTKFQPMNINYGIMKDLGYKVKKKDRKELIRSIT